MLCSYAVCDPELRWPSIVHHQYKASIYAGIQLDFFDCPNEGYITVIGQCHAAEIFFLNIFFLGQNFTLFNLQSDLWQASKVFGSSSKVMHDWTAGWNTTVDKLPVQEDMIRLY